ncbi:hypothetical protein [Chitinolyticbacter albus]|uniref:hypothetical protein n=1 Tax=Chitinolyticbacter albus TaxID=2961951 RepID=UPI0021090937|nr:hypothetical protein [Chitinolyticbacter albus]
MNHVIVALVLALIAGAAPADATAESRNMDIAQPEHASAILSKVNLDRVKRHIIVAGSRCTYANKYNHNPCLATSDFHLYLNPDPGPDGHPQWNIDCDVTRGDFNTLVVQEKHDQNDWHMVAFMGIDKPVHVRSGSRRVLEQAVRQVLDQLSASDTSGQ